MRDGWTGNHEPFCVLMRADRRAQVRARGGCFRAYLMATAPDGLPVHVVVRRGTDADFLTADEAAMAADYAIEGQGGYTVNLLPGDRLRDIEVNADA